MFGAQLRFFSTALRHSVVPYYISLVLYTKHILNSYLFSKGLSYSAID